MKPVHRGGLENRSRPSHLGKRAVFEPRNDAPALLPPVREVFKTRPYFYESVALAAKSEYAAHRVSLSCNPRAVFLPTDPSLGQEGLCVKTIMGDITKTRSRLLV